MDEINKIPNHDEFHSCYFIVGFNDYNVDLSQDFFDHGDNSSIYFSL